MLLMTQNMLSCYAAYVLFFFTIRWTLLKCSGLGIRIGMICWRGIIQWSSRREMPGKWLISIGSFQGQKSLPESLIWTTLTLPEWLPSGSGTRKPLSLPGDLSTMSLTCATITDPTREPLLESTPLPMSTLGALDDHLKGLTEGLF